MIFTIPEVFVDYQNAISVTFIYNIALQNMDFGVLQKSSKHFLITIFFPPGEGGRPCLSPPHTHLVLRASNNEDLFFICFCS